MQLPTLRSVETFVRIWRSVDGQHHELPAAGVSGRKPDRDQRLEARAGAVGAMMRQELGEQMVQGSIVQLVKLMSSSKEMPQLEPVQAPVEQILLYAPEETCCQTVLVARPAQIHADGDANAPFFVVHRDRKPPAEGREFGKTCSVCMTEYRYTEVITPPSRAVGAVAPRRRNYRSNAL